MCVRRFDTPLVYTAAWLIAVACGWWALTAYSLPASPRVELEPPSRWPEDSGIAAPAEGNVLLIFVHPRCPCTQATIAELAKLRCHLLRRGAGRWPSTYIVATIPQTRESSWTDSPLLRRAVHELDGTLVLDENGLRSKRFGATHSGTVLLYNDQKIRRYAGGVTIARGHEGDNRGLQSLQSILLGENVQPVSLPALGCRLVMVPDGALGAVHSPIASQHWKYPPASIDDEERTHD